MANCQFGEWATCADLLNARYGNFYSRLMKFAWELGADPFNRQFSPTALINFAIERNIAEQEIDYIYKQFVYYKITLADPTIDCSELEMFDLIAEFEILHVELD